MKQIRIELRESPGKCFTITLVPGFMDTINVSHSERSDEPRLFPERSMLYKTTCHYLFVFHYKLTCFAKGKILHSVLDDAYQNGVNLFEILTYYTESAGFIALARRQ